MAAAARFPTIARFGGCHDERGLSRTGGKDGDLHEDGNAAEVEVRPGMVVEFEVTRGSARTIEDVIADVPTATLMA